MTADTLIKVDPSLRQQIEQRSGEKMSDCYQCTRCTSGCPLTFAMDIMPHQVVRLLHLGQADRVLASNTIWVCAACETCSTRCPNGVDVAHLMDTMRQMSWQENTPALRHEDTAFHTEFLESIKRYGRIAELRLITSYTLKTSGIAGLLKQASVGLNMMLKGKLSILPEMIKGRKNLRNIFQVTRKGTR